MNSQPADKQQPGQPPTLKQLIMSILGAAFGVQNSATQKRDFQQSSPVAYIIGGILFGVIFVLSLILLVKVVVP